ncbi:hypothetical protein EX895_005871 [Sporisorium graminicola]|uniref:thioredoxin-dependent peroxiredoxin n=1 Tax=Sporisorium graminicola TaxID=280036 RepID=A0A4U7KKW0_9BASI|nr:hypothetical protein EX895_005871 [Sporisorium graminicola]TKY84791.1 hypothetical protein EX895_005871 [Sporisorium graminicola]
MPYLPRVPAFPIAGERSIITAAGVALKIPAKERASPLIGHLAPEIYAKDHLGRDVSLHATIQLGRPIVLYFFPLAGSPHCTKESCSFRDAVGTSPIFNDLNAVVIGISQDPPTRSKRFVDEHHLGFRILHDSDRQIMDAWGVGRGLLGLIDGRCTFVIDHDGIVRAMLDGVWDYKGHRDFAEKWLCRIEHELSGRERFYVEHEADDSAACDEISRNIKVVYGDAVPGRGIATAPRHGAAPTATKLKGRLFLDPTRPESISLAAEAHGSGSTARPKSSRRNLKNWLRPSEPSSNVYDEPLHVDYRHSTGVRSADRVAARVQSMRLDESSSSSSDQAGVVARDFAEASQLTRNGSGSGSGWATPSTISARSVSTGETSHTSPGPEPHAHKLAAAIHIGVGAGAHHAELERSGSPSRRAGALVNGLGIGAAQGALPKARSSSLINKRASSADSAAAAPGGEASTDAAAGGKGGGEANGGATVYANGNIARMPLLPPMNEEASNDTTLKVRDRRSRIGLRTGDVSTDSTYSSNGVGSLPVPPRPSTRNGATGGVVPTAAASGGSAGHDGGDGNADGYDTDRGQRRRDASTASSSAAGSGESAPAPLSNATATPLPAQPAPPSARPTHSASNTPSTSPSMSFANWASPSARAFRAANGYPSPSPSFGGVHNGVFAITNAGAIAMGEGMAGVAGLDRRLSNTPSLANSMVSYDFSAHSEYDYSPSLAESTHTFGGVED